MRGAARLLFLRPMRLALVLSPICALAAAGQLPSSASLLNQALEADRKLGPVQAQYTYIEELRNQQIDKNGKPGAVDRKTYDVVFVEGEPYRKLILLDGKPLSPDRQRKVEEDLARTREERLKARREGGIHRSVSVGGLEALRDYFDTRITGEAVLRGHPVWVMESTPRKMKEADKKQEELRSWKHKSWFAKEDGMRIQWTSELVRAANGLQPKSMFTWELDQGDENCWLLRRVTGDVLFSAYRVIRTHTRSDQTFTNYRKFDVSSTITPIE